MRKKIYISIVVLFINNLNLHSQDLNNNKIGVTFYTGSNEVLDNDYHSSSTFQDIQGYLIGLSYIRVYNEHFQWETGLNFSRNFYKISKDVELINDRWSRVQPSEIISIPFSPIIKTTNGFFVSPGFQIDIDVNHWTKYIISNQSGIGLFFSAGKIFHVSENYYLTIAPTVKIHSILPFNDNVEYRSLEYGINFNITYGFLQ